MTARMHDRETKDDGSFAERLLAQLIAARHIDEDGADRARRAHARAGGSLVDILVRLGLAQERDVAGAVVAVSGCAAFDAGALPAEPLFGDRLSVRFLREAKLLPLADSDGAVLVATADPANAFAAQALRLALGRDVRFVIARGSEIEEAIARLYEPMQGAGAETARDVTDADLVRLRENANEAPIVRFVERLIARAVESRASDIHIEPLERALRVRIRIDGVLKEDEAQPLSSASAIVSRIKILAGLDIAERRLPQDGAIKTNVRGREIDFRVATAPVAHGESVVIRVLDKSSVRLDLAALGFDGAVLRAIETILTRPNGIFLVTGPTGSGKSTTLYAALDRLNDASRKIVTVEDPVEYKIDGLNQVQVKPEIGLDFARVLRSTLRHDPDVIMVGEIRDAETARIAVQASLTGHLVLSTLHTNDAASAVTRLLDMGVEDYLLASTIAGVMAQRLVRVLCASCKTPAEVPGHLYDAAQALGFGTTHKATMFAPAGCAACNGTGFRGRRAIAELLVPDDAMRRLILKRADAVALNAAAIAGGMTSLYRGGLALAFAGETTADEVMRVAQDVS